jgi:hypothetical protein
MSVHVVDLVRITAVLIAGVCMVLMALRAHRARVIAGDGFAPWATAALLGSMVFVIAQEAQQIGKPFVWWRLPLLLLIVLCTLRALWRSRI